VRLVLGAWLAASFVGAAGAQTPVRPDQRADRIAADAPVAQTADPAVEAKTRDVAAQLRCPVCQGLSIQDSPSELAQEMKAVVREQLAAGKSEAQVKQFFVAKYGEWILLQPEASGFNLLVYALPVVALLVGAALVIVVVRRWTTTTPGGDAELTPKAMPDEVDGRSMN
jgi:cytochrome c-type biogenesis protein CcmH